MSNPTPKKKHYFLFGTLKGQEINLCEDAEALKWYLDKIGAKHWQYYIVSNRLKTVEFLGK
jgi:hypothetical protein